MANKVPIWPRFYLCLLPILCRFVCSFNFIRKRNILEVELRQTDTNAKVRTGLLCWLGFSAGCLIMCCSISFCRTRGIISTSVRCNWPCKSWMDLSLTPCKWKIIRPNMKSSATRKPGKARRRKSHSLPVRRRKKRIRIRIGSIQRVPWLSLFWVSENEAIRFINSIGDLQGRRSIWTWCPRSKTILRFYGFESTRPWPSWDKSRLSRWTNSKSVGF